MPVRGWLLLLCFLLTVWDPATFALVAAGRAGGGQASAVSLASLAIRVVVTGVGIAAGMALWEKRPGAVALAKGALVLSTVEAIGRLSTRVGFSDAPPGLRLPLAVALTLFNGAWYLYLEKSRRVRETYALESADNR